ncbi:MAG: hypothetical protein C0436_04070 [Alphaproteobacteria bacterium]|nr:hypothetical protein [Alphaproteobacteria bacterium]
MGQDETAAGGELVCPGSYARCLQYRLFAHPNKQKKDPEPAHRAEQCRETQAACEAALILFWMAVQVAEWLGVVLNQLG